MCKLYVRTLKRDDTVNNLQNYCRVVLLYAPFQRCQSSAGWKVLGPTPPVKGVEITPIDTSMGVNFSYP